MAFRKNGTAFTADYHVFGRYGKPGADSLQYQL